METPAGLRNTVGKSHQRSYFGGFLKENTTWQYPELEEKGCVGRKAWLSLLRLVHFPHGGELLGKRPIL
jgi:hypothetical protein